MAYQIFERIGTRGSAQNTGNAEYTRLFRVVFDDYMNDVTIAGSLPEIPSIFSTYPSDLFAVVSRITPEQNPDDPSVWDIAVDYSRISRDPLQANTDPTARPTKIRWGTHKYERPCIRDINGKFVFNSAADVFVPPEMMDDSRIVVTATSNQAYVPTYMLDITDCINATAFSIEGIPIPKGCAKVQTVEVSELQFENEIYFRTVQVVLEIRNNYVVNKVSIGIGGTATVTSNVTVDGWQKCIQDAGYRNFFSSKSTRMTDDYGFPLQSPALLDGQGVKLTTPVTTGTEVYRVFDIYQTFDPTILNLPA
jgi:hypothetical protein